ncbi:hypothetical protein KUCAC02_017743, partial [Chaenocephalus aceratus]
KKLKQWKASSAKRDLCSLLESPPAEIITVQQPERPASSGRRASVATGRYTTPLVEFCWPQSRDAGDEDSTMRYTTLPPSMEAVLTRVPGLQHGDPSRHTRIPELFDRMECSPSSDAPVPIISHSIGPLLYGHHAGVYPNMTNSE